MTKSEKYPQMIENRNDYIYRISPTMSSLIIDEEKLRKQIRKINPKKAADPDDITSKELSILQDDVMEGIKVVFNKSIACNQYPSIWKLAKVKSAFKKGEKIESPNYRPLSMLSIPGKLFEGQACDNIDKHVTIHNLLSKNQWGFTKAVHRIFSAGGQLGKIFFWPSYLYHQKTPFYTQKNNILFLN